jgi:nucleolar protein 56
MEKSQLKWYGLEREHRIYLFRDLEKNYIEIFRKLRNGEIPEIEERESNSIPDIRNLMLEFGKERIKESRTEDRFLIRFYNLRSELDRIINLYFERVSGFGAFAGKLLDDMDPCALFRELPSIMGEGPNQKIIENIALTGKKLCDLRGELVNFMSEEIKLVMPNVTTIAGTELALDLLSAGKGLQHLAEFPASTIQVLGAEKAFFKHLKTGSPSPKHGVMFKLPHLTGLPKNQRGKYARTAASKIAIAARADYLGSTIDAGKMKTDLDERLKKIRGSGSSRARTGKNTSRPGLGRDRSP